MKSRLADFSMANAKWIFLATLLTSFVAAALIPKIIIDTDPENMLPSDQAERVYHNQIKQRFNLHDAIVVGTVNETSIFNPQSLSGIESLVEQISKIDGVVLVDLMALSTVDNISQEDGAIRFEWMMKKAPTNQEGADWINQNIDRLPLLQNTLVSADDKASIIYVPILDKNESYRIATEIQQIINNLETEDEYHITGLPVAEDTFGYQMFVQMGISAPLAALMIFGLMWLFFRNLKFIAAPMIIAMATVIITMGIMIGMGFKVHIMSSMIAIFLMPIAVVDSIHIMSEFADNYKQNSNRKDVIRRVIHHLFKPMLFTSITSAVGFASLLLTPIPPVQIFGAFIAFGILLAFALTIIFIPAYLSVLKTESLASLTKANNQTSWLDKWLPVLGKKSLAHSRVLIMVFMALIAISIWGLSKIQINDNPVRWFKSDHSIRIADKTLNQHFAGTYDAYLVLEKDQTEIAQKLEQILKQAEISINNDLPLGSKLSESIMTLEDELFDDPDNQALGKALNDIDVLNKELNFFQQPQQLKIIENIQAALLDTQLVGKSMSLADAVKTVNRDLVSGTEKDYKIPATQAGVAQVLLQYQSSHRPHDLWHFITQDYSSSLIWVQMTSGDNQQMSKIVSQINQYLNENPLSQGVSAKWAGKTYLNKVWQDEMVAGMLISLISAFVVVLIMMILLFRSLVFGVLAMLPLTITILVIYGLIGWIGKDYDMPIAVLSALTLGLSVDFAIHFLQRARDIFAETNNFKLTMLKMFAEPANAISRNAIVIALGFTPLLLAPLIPYVTVGFFLASIMAVSALVTLLLLPSAMSLLKNFLFKSRNIK